MGNDSKYLETLFGLSGKIAVVTGAGGVLLGTISKALARVGVKVAVLDLIPEAAHRVTDSIVSAGGKAIAVKCDVLDKASLKEACRTVCCCCQAHPRGKGTGPGGRKQIASSRLAVTLRS